APVLPQNQSGVPPAGADQAAAGGAPAVPPEVSAQSPLEMGAVAAPPAKPAPSHAPVQASAKPPVERPVATPHPTPRPAAAPRAATPAGAACAAPSASPSPPAPARPRREEPMAVPEPQGAAKAARHPLVERILTGSAPDPLRLAAARGSLPLPLQDLVYAQICL